MFFSSTASRAVLISNGGHQQEVVRAIERGAPKCKVYLVTQEEDAFKLVAGFQQGGALPDFVMVDASAVGSELDKVVNKLRRLTGNASPIVMLLEDSGSHPCKSYGANSCIERSVESISAAAQYWAEINLAKPYAQIG